MEHHLLVLIREGKERLSVSVDEIRHRLADRGLLLAELTSAVELPLLL